MIALIYALSTLLYLSAHVAAIGRRPRFEPLPMCFDCVSREDILAPGIGFDLTTSYATVAIRYYDGTVENLAKVDAGDDYRQVMNRMSEPSSRSNCNEGYWDKINCHVIRARRRWNKLLGRPSTPEVGTIAKLIYQLRTVADQKLEPEVTKKALVTIPSLPGLSHEDLQDALEYTGLTILSTHKHIGDKVSEVSAAFAGYGYGLCEHYENVDACEGEEADMPVSHILALSLSQTSFSAAYTYMQAAYRSILEKETIRYDLGLQHFPAKRADTHEQEALYWSRMRAAIVEVGRASRGVLTTLLLLGEDANNPGFIRTVQDALRELLPDASAQQLPAVVLSGKQNSDVGPLYLAARGAAEFAKRAQEAPVGCREPAHCAENRVPPKNILFNQISLGEDRQKLEYEL